MNRRGFLQASAILGAGISGWPPAEASPAPTYEIPTDPEATFFSAADRQTLSALADQIYPGSGGLGAVRFIERLLTAFDHTPPRIYSDGAGGFLPLNRVQERSWRLFLYGSQACGGGPNDAVIGPVNGLRNDLTAIVQAGSWSALTVAQQQVLTALTLQSVLADPAYGGNLDRAGWQAIYFPGPGLPQGFSTYDAPTGAYLERPDFPLSTPNPGADPLPVDWITLLFLRAEEL